MEQTSLLTKMPLGKWLLAGLDTDWKRLPSQDELKPIDYADVKEAFALFRGHDEFCGSAILQYTPDSMLTPDVAKWVDEISRDDEVYAFLSKYRRMTDIPLSTEKVCNLMRARGELFYHLPLTVRKQKPVQLAAIAGCPDGPTLGAVLSNISYLIDIPDEERISVAVSTHPANCLKNIVSYLTAENFTLPVQAAMVQSIRDYDKEFPLFKDSIPFLTDEGTNFFEKLYKTIWNAISLSTLANGITRALLDAFPESLGAAVNTRPLPEECYLAAVGKNAKLLHLLPPSMNDSEEILRAAIPNEREVFLVQSQLANLRDAGVKEDEISVADICEELGVTLTSPNRR